MQTGGAHFRNALCRQESSHLVEKGFRGRALRQVFLSLPGLCLDIRGAVIGKFPADDVPVSLSVQLIDEIPNIPDIAVLQDFPCR